MDFELELIRRDDINVAYIVALLMSLNAAIKEGSISTSKAKVQRKRIFDLLHSETQLIDKRDLITRLIDQKLPMLGPEEDVRTAYPAYWSEERDAAFAAFCARENLDPAALTTMIGQMVYTNKDPLGDEVVSAMTEKPSILKRRTTIDRIVAGMKSLLTKFEDGVGELSEE